MGEGVPGSVRIQGGDGARRGSQQGGGAEEEHDLRGPHPAAQGAGPVRRDDPHGEEPVRASCGCCGGVGEIERTETQCDDSTGYNRVEHGTGIYRPCPECHEEDVDDQD